jgi:hypothetical protein
MNSLRAILEECWAAQVPAKPQRFRSPTKQRLAEIIRHRQRVVGTNRSMQDLVGDLIGSVRNDGLPTDLSSNKKKYLPALIRAKKRHRR